MNMQIYIIESSKNKNKFILVNGNAQTVNEFNTFDEAADAIYEYQDVCAEYETEIEIQEHSELEWI